ncbi:MAG: hypothetical protein JSR98_18610 [Proteobacteria bacterium]|nr:hypothetical protein [Pseudomonadota bacterium]
MVFIASLLSRAGVVSTSEFSSLLSVFADTVAETEPGEGALLAAWAADVETGPRQ